MSVSEVTATHLNIGHMFTSAMGTWTTNEFQGLANKVQV